MPAPIVIAYHLVWTAYGWWLPNDPRGSMSRCIASDVLADLGALHFGRKRVQPARRDLLNFLDKSESLLRFARPTFNPTAVNVIAEAFGAAVPSHRYTCYACAIMPDHVHLVIRKHKHQAEEMVLHLQRESQILLKERELREREHPVWGGHGWKVFLDHPDDVWRTIKYVDDNPVKVRMPRQSWSFVTPYDNWPLHEGHSATSPYAKRLRGRK